MNQPLFSVIVPTFNRPSILQRTLDCLENQQCDFPFEVIVVDDYPENVLPDLVFGKGKRCNWRIIRNGKNLGRAATRNVGIRAAQGEYILFLDDDIWAIPTLLQAYYKRQRKDDGCAIVGGAMPSDEIKNSVWNRYSIKRFNNIQAKLKKNILDHTLFLTGNVLLPYKIIEKIGLFNESLVNYEDTEMGYRLFKNKVAIIYEPEACGYHYFDDDLNSLCQDAYGCGISNYRYVKLHPEERKNREYDRYFLGTWHNNKVKNILKLLLFNRLATAAIKYLIVLMALFKFKDGFLFYLLNTLEYLNMKQGIVDAERADRN